MALSTAPSTDPAESLFDAAERAHIVEWVAQHIEEQYLSPQVAVQMATAIRAKAAAGGYEKVATQADLARIVSEDLFAAGHDRRAKLDFEAWHLPTTAERAAALRDLKNRKGGGFGPGGRLPNNVDRVVINSFEPVDDARHAVEEHMGGAGDADALVIDLTNNTTDGDPATVALVASYLFDGPRVHVDDTWFRSTGTTEASWTDPSAPGRHLGGKKPVVVVTSSRTASAGEELAYALQATHRAIVVGERTAGTAHPVAIEKLTGFTLHIPYGRIINAVTKKDWEGVGVVPDLVATEDSALKVGYVKALRGVIAGNGVSEATRRGLRMALRALGEKD